MIVFVLFFQQFLLLNRLNWRDFSLFFDFVYALFFGGFFYITFYFSFVAPRNVDPKKTRLIISQKRFLRSRVFFFWLLLFFFFLTIFCFVSWLKIQYIWFYATEGRYFMFLGFSLPKQIVVARHLILDFVFCIFFFLCVLFAVLVFFDVLSIVLSDIIHFCLAILFVLFFLKIFTNKTVRSFSTQTALLGFN